MARAIGVHGSQDNCIYSTPFARFSLMQRATNGLQLLTSICHFYVTPFVTVNHILYLDFHDRVTEMTVNPKRDIYALTTKKSKKRIGVYTEKLIKENALRFVTISQ